MNDLHNALFLEEFYPKECFRISNIRHENKRILIQIKSITHSCVCPRCGSKTDKCHGTYIRKVQDLPILGKNVQLEIKAHEYRVSA